jgi:S1-C subfamily serine protease
MTQALATFSAAVSQLVAAAAPRLAAIRIAPGRHLTALVCEDDTIVTIDQVLPALDSYTVVLSNRVLVAARPGPRDATANVAVLHLDRPWPAANPPVAEAPLGSIAVILGADAEASPTVRLTVIHRFIRSPDGPVPVLDLPAGSIAPGSLVLDPDGRLIGLVASSANGEAIAVPSVVIGRMMTPNPGLNPKGQAPAPQTPPPFASNRRGWLGVALQPITVPDQLVPRTGQASGRMVVSITKGGPAELAGIRVGDVLLALDGTSTTGPYALRAFVGGERIGTTVEVRVLRDGSVLTTDLTIAVRPD